MELSPNVPHEASNASRVAQDLKVLLFYATGATCLGLLLNGVRDRPLPLVYQSKQQRIEMAAEKMAEPQLQARQRPEPWCSMLNWPKFRRWRTTVRPW